MSNSSFNPHGVPLAGLGAGISIGLAMREVARGINDATAIAIAESKRACLRSAAARRRAQLALEIEEAGARASAAAAKYRLGDGQYRPMVPPRRR